MRQVSRNPSKPCWLPVTHAHTSVSAVVPFSRMLVGGHDSQTGKQSGGRGVTVYLCTCTSVYKQKLCGLTHTPSWETDSVSSVIPVMSIKLEWLTGRVWDGDGMGETGPRPWEVSEQAADNVDVIALELTGRDLIYLILWCLKPGIIKCIHSFYTASSFHPLYTYLLV